MVQKTTKELCALLGLVVREAVIPKQANRPAKKGTPKKKSAVHETANENVGANAEMHRRYVLGGGGPDFTSYHYVVDDHEAINLIPEDEVAYHGGTPESNTFWFGMELCVNLDGDWVKTVHNGAKLQAALTVRYDKPLSWVVQHNLAYGKDCPHKLRQGMAWVQFLALVGDYANELQKLLKPAPAPTPEPVPNPTPTSRYFKETGFYVGGGFLKEWDKHGLEVMGFPITMEYAEDGFVRQRFENTQLRWKAGEPVRFDAIGRKLTELEKTHP